MIYQTSGSQWVTVMYLSCDLFTEDIAKTGKFCLFIATHAPTPATHDLTLSLVIRDGALISRRYLG
jgi:hypothetical protein